MFGEKEIRTMGQIEWVKLTLQDSGKTIHANRANITMIEGHKNGARIWFLANARDGIIDVSETAEVILKQRGEVQDADPS
jgi:hypothetical protein